MATHDGTHGSLSYWHTVTNPAPEPSRWPIAEIHGELQGPAGAMAPQVEVGVELFAPCVLDNPVIRSSLPAAKSP